MLPAKIQGETAIITVDAACYWTETGVQVQENRAYRVRVLDMSSVWDWNIRVPNLDGWPRSFRRTLFTALLFWARRRPVDPWFALIATVDRKHPRWLREDREYIAPASGELVCYFNGLPVAYGNNHGIAKLQRISQ
jgi:hypothetical protein